MKHHYRDIRNELGEPVWWDEAGVPRYCEFGVHETNVVYVDEVALLEIACQGCGTVFQVAMSWNNFNNLFRKDRVPPLSERIRDGIIHYGDPPNGDCCAAGASMNSIPLRVLEFWQRESYDWVRKPEYERVVGHK